MKILLLSHEPFSIWARLRRTYNTLIKKHKVCLVDATRDSDRGIEQTDIGISLKGYSGSGFTKYIMFVINMIRNGRKQSYDVIYGINYYTALPALVLSLLSGKPIIYDASELFIPIRHQTFTLRLWFFYIIEKQVILKAKLLFCANRERAIMMAGYYRLGELPIVVRNISEFKGVTPIKELIITGETRSTIRIAYIGVIRNIKYIKQLAETISKSPYKLWIQVDLYGHSLNMAALEQVLSKYPFIRHYGGYNNNDVPKILQEVHIGFLYYSNEGWNNRFCSPNKVYDYVFQGIPSLAPFNEGLNELIAPNGIGECGDDIEKGLCKIIENYPVYIKNIQKFAKEKRGNPDLKNILTAIDKI